MEDADEIPKNEIISIGVLQNYISKYPEDAPKWLEFLNPPNDKITTRRMRYTRIRRREVVGINDIIHPPSEPDDSVTKSEIGCIICKSTWETTSLMPKTKLLCGHEFHTLCLFLKGEPNGIYGCDEPDCEISTHTCVQRLIRIRDENSRSVENALIDAACNTADFKKDLKNLKSCIKNVSKANTLLNSRINKERKSIIHRHIFEINQLQAGLNSLTSTVLNGDEQKANKLAIRRYRKVAGLIFNKYHLSLRDLIKNNKVKVAWSLRHTLEYHRYHFRSYKLGIRIYPGRKLWTDPGE